ncbi:hypothetical protein Tco_0039473 [Tanacetum coccineum]
MAPKKEKAPSASEPTKSGGGKQKKKLSGSRLSWVGSHFSHKFGIIFKPFCSRSLGNEVIRMTWVPQLHVPDDQLSVQNKQHVTGTWSYSSNSSRKCLLSKLSAFKPCMCLKRDHMITRRLQNLLSTTVSINTKRNGTPKRLWANSLSFRGILS